MKKMYIIPIICAVIVFIVSLIMIQAGESRIVNTWGYPLPWWPALMLAFLAFLISFAVIAKNFRSTLYVGGILVVLAILTLIYNAKFESDFYTNRRKPFLQNRIPTIVGQKWSQQEQAAINIAEGEFAKEGRDRNRYEIYGVGQVSDPAQLSKMNAPVGHTIFYVGYRLPNMTDSEIVIFVDLTSGNVIKVVYGVA